MAEIGKVLNRTVSRTKEKVLQNLWKVDRTKDEEIDNYVLCFNKQQDSAIRLQKEIKRYLLCIKAMSQASQNMYKTIKESYEPDWPGYTDTTATIEHLAALWDDHVTQMYDELQVPFVEYTNRGNELKSKIAKRGRKLTDFDSARRTHDSLFTSKKPNEAKISEALNDLNDSRRIYENINSYLHEELPIFYTSRIPFMASLFNSLFQNEATFQSRSANLKELLVDISAKLCAENQNFNPCHFFNSGDGQKSSFEKKTDFEESCINSSDIESISAPKIYSRPIKEVPLAKERNLVTPAHRKEKETSKSLSSGRLITLANQASQTGQAAGSKSHDFESQQIFQPDTEHGEIEEQIKTPPSVQNWAWVKEEGADNGEWKVVSPDYRAEKGPTSSQETDPNLTFGIDTWRDDSDEGHVVTDEGYVVTDEGHVRDEGHVVTDVERVVTDEERDQIDVKPNIAAKRHLKTRSNLEVTGRMDIEGDRVDIGSKSVSKNERGAKTRMKDNEMNVVQDSTDICYLNICEEDEGQTSETNVRDTGQRSVTELSDRSGETDDTVKPNTAVDKKVKPHVEKRLTTDVHKEPTITPSTQDINAEATSLAQDTETSIYSFAEDTDDIYKFPTSNEPVEPAVSNKDPTTYQVEVTHAYVGDDVDELSILPGDIITVVPFDGDLFEQDEGWLLGIKESTKQKGVFPMNFTRPINSSGQS